MTSRSSRIVLFLVMTAAVIAFGLGVSFASAMSDRDFVIKAEDSNMLGVALGQTAQQQASTADIRRLGKMMATDHIIASNKLLGISKKDNLLVPMDMDKKDHEELTHLSGLMGRDFDLAFVKQVIEDHKEDVKMFEQMSKDGANPDLKNYAEQTLPTLREHLRMAQSIYDRIERQG